jgi:hypothetical protein
LVFGDAPAEETDDDNAAIENYELEHYLSESSGGCHRGRSEPVERRYEIDLEQKEHAGRMHQPGRAQEDDRSCDVDSIAGVHVT